MSHAPKLPPPDYRVRTHYMLECECSKGALDDGGPKDAPRLRRLAAKRRETCNATMRLNRTLTWVWKGKGHP